MEEATYRFLLGFKSLRELPGRRPGKSQGTLLGKSGKIGKLGTRTLPGTPPRTPPGTVLGTLKGNGKNPGGHLGTIREIPRGQGAPRKDRREFTGS